MTSDPTEILRNSRVVVRPETFAVVGIGHSDWLELLADPTLSPRMTTPFMLFYDGTEVTMLLDDGDLSTMRPGLDKARIENGFRMLTFDAAMPFDVVGFIAEISRILAEAAIPIISLSSFSGDHLLIKQTDLGNVLKALGPHVSELC